MNDTMTFNVHTEHTARDVIGGDTSITSVPDALWVNVNGERALNVQLVGRFLRDLATSQAHNLGEELHHAEFVMTADPAVVESRGNMHPGCAECDAGVRAGLRHLREHPGTQLFVGQLFWAAAP